MALLNISSPHSHKGRSTRQVMQWVMLAALPGMLVQSWFFGVGVILNVLLAIAGCLAFEAMAMALRKRPVRFYLTDYSAAVTGLLLGLSLPPLSPWWLVISGCFFAIILAKQLYGGMGFNPFNPAMVAYVILLISFPVEMTRWAAPAPLAEAANVPGIAASLEQIWGGNLVDGYTAATPLDIMKQNSGLLINDLYQQQALFNQGSWAAAGWEWVNAAFLLGGLLLLALRIIRWHAPISMLLALVVMSALFNDGGSSQSHGSPLFHLFSGATMLGAFFIVTDPVSSAVSNKGRIIFGASVGVLVYVIRSWGNYPDAIAFAVLLMNFAAPFIDYYTVPRTYGHKKSTPATRKED